MKLLGDVPEEHKKLAVNLEQMEQYFDGAKVTTDIAAKGFVCLAHDWFQIGVEDEGNRLLVKAERICPGYFKNVMVQQTLEDKEFSYLVKSLSVELAWMLINKINDIKETK